MNVRVCVCACVCACVRACVRARARARERGSMIPQVITADAPSDYGSGDSSRQPAQEMTVPLARCVQRADVGQDAPLFPASPASFRPLPPTIPPPPTHHHPPPPSRPVVSSLPEGGGQRTGLQVTYYPHPRPPPKGQAMARGRRGGGGEGWGREAEGEARRERSVSDVMLPLKPPSGGRRSTKIAIEELLKSVQVMFGIVSVNP